MTAPAPGAPGRRTRAEEGENRLPPAVAVLVALVVYALLPEGLLPAPRWLVPGLEVALLAALVAANPRRITRELAWARVASMVLALLVIGANLVSLGLLAAELSGNTHQAGNLLVAAMQLWVTNTIGFGLLFWEVDRGGPIARSRYRAGDGTAVDLSFPQDQMSDPDAPSDQPVWMPLFVDYLYVSLTNSVAFSPTDTMPLTTRAKVLMAVQAVAALLISLLLVSRAVNSLG